MHLRATFQALYAIMFYDHRKSVEQILHECGSVMPSLLIEIIMMAIIQYISEYYYLSLIPLLDLHF